MKPKKILFVSQYYFPFAGGVETHVRQIAQAFSQENQVEIIAANFTTSQLPTKLTPLHYSVLMPEYESYQDGKVKVHALTPTKISDRFKLLPLALRIAPVIQSVLYDQLHAWGYQFYRSVYYDRMKSIMTGMDVVHSIDRKSVV